MEHISNTKAIQSAWHVAWNIKTDINTTWVKMYKCKLDNDEGSADIKVLYLCEVFSSKAVVNLMVKSY